MNSPPVAGTFLVVTAAACGLFAVGTHQAATALRDHGVRTTATVLDVRPGFRGRSYVVLRFTAEDGHEVVAEVGDYYWRPAPRPGDRPTIVYDPADPAGNVADVRIGAEFYDTWALAVGGLLAGALAWPTYAGRIDWAAWSRW